MRRRAVRENWPCIEVPGNGGLRKEYPVSQLPADVQQAIAKHEAAEAKKNLPALRAETLPAPVQPLEQLKGWQRDVLIARTVVLRHLAKMEENCGGPAKAASELIRQAENGTLPAVIQEALKTANARHGTAASFGSMMALWRDDMLSDVLNNLDSIVCYDKQPYLDTDHVAPNGAIVSNKGTKKLDFSTLAKAQGSFGAGKSAMTALKNKDDKSLRVRPTVLVVGNDLEDMANTGMTAEKLDDGKVNIYRNSCKVLVVPDMPAEHWLLIDDSKPMKPFIMQVELDAQPLPPPSVDSDMWKLEEKAVFGCKARGAANVGMWQLAWGSDGTVA